jgi:hypothetical protein
MLLGMSGKGFVDWLDKPDKETLKMHCRNALIAVLVSPMVRSRRR